MAHNHFRVSDSASTFASHIRALHEEIREKIMKNNTNYEAFADLHRRLRTFNEGDYVIRIRPDQFSSGTVKKLHTKAHDPSKSTRKSIQLLIWWISHRTLASVALLMLRT